MSSLRSAPSRRRNWMWLAVAAAACGAFGTVFVQSSWKGAVDVVLSDIDRARAAAGLQIFNPAIAGRTDTGEPFVLTAESALPDGPTPERVRLTQITGSATLQDGRAVDLAANSGVVFVKTQLVRLIGGVRVESRDGFWFVTDSADLDTRRGAIASVDSAVIAGGPIGRLRADEMRIRREGPAPVISGQAPPRDADAAAAQAAATARAGSQIITFSGGVRMTIQPRDPALAPGRP